MQKPLTLDLDLYISGGITDPALQVILDGKLVNEWTKTNPLHQTPDTNFKF